MTDTKGKVVSVNGNLVSVRFDGNVSMNELCYVVVDGTKDVLRAKMYEAYFCCTMRLAEGLWYLTENKDLFAAHLEGSVSKKGRVYTDGDILYAEVTGGAEKYAEHFVEIDGHVLCPIVKYYKLPRDIMEASEQRILF